MSAAQFEVELKFPVQDATAVRERLAVLGACWSEAVRHRDVYFAHPARDFRSTDEALRTRTIGEVTTLTYKGPVIDRATKTRREIEVDLQPGAGGTAALTQILEHLSFRKVREVTKTRQTAVITWQGIAVTCGWDEAPPLGTYLELEVVTDEAGKPAAQAGIIDLARHLQLPAQEHRSYLALMLAHDDQQQQTGQ